MPPHRIHALLAEQEELLQQITTLPLVSAATQTTTQLGQILFLDAVVPLAILYRAPHVSALLATI